MLAVGVLLLALSWQEPTTNVVQNSSEARAEAPARFGDFAAYWSAGRLLWERKNNFDPKIVGDFEKQQGLSQTFVIWNPPWVFPFLAPFALLPFDTAAVCWLLANVVLLLASSIHFAGQSNVRPVLAVILGITFLPACICLGISQLAILVLAGLAGYSRASLADRPFLAGLALTLAAIKPHLVGLVWIGLLFDGDTRQKILRLSGLATGLVGLTLIALAIRPDVVADYLAAVGKPPVDPPTQFYSATLGMWLRMEVFGGHPTWVQFLPFALAALAFMAWRPTTNRPAREILLIAIVGSTLATPYAWHYDQAVLAPAYLGLWASVLVETERPARGRRLILLGLIAFEVGMFLMVAFKVNERFYVVWPWLIAGLCSVNWLQTVGQTTEKNKVGWDKR